MLTRLVVVVALGLLVNLLQHGAVSAQTTGGTWELYPPQVLTYSVEVRPPLRPSVSTIVRSKEVPIKFHAFTVAGPVIFESILSDTPTTNDFSFLKFTPTPTLGLTFIGLYNLTAGYAYTMGNCGGGALRWSVRVDIGNDGDPSNDGSVFIYYGVNPAFDDCNPPSTNNQSGQNMISRIGPSELRYDTSQVGGTFYDSYANAQTLVGNLPVLRASLVVDTGWFAGDDKLNISNVTANDNTFIPLSGSTRTCDLSPATIKVTKLASNLVGSPISVQPSKSDTFFRVVDCMYIYNLDTTSLLGPGDYKVEAIISGSPAAGEALFTIP